MRKLGAPGHEELAMDAIGAGGVRVLNDEVIRTLHIASSEIDAVTRRESFDGCRAPFRSARVCEQPRPRFETALGSHGDPASVQSRYHRVGCSDRDSNWSSRGRGRPMGRANSAVDG